MTLNTYYFEVTHKSGSVTRQHYNSRKPETALKAIKQMFQKQQGYISHKLIGQNNS